MLAPPGLRDRLVRVVQVGKQVDTCIVDEAQVGKFSFWCQLFPKVFSPKVLLLTMHK